MGSNKKEEPGACQETPLARKAASGMPCIVKGDNDILIDEFGHRCIDLFSGHGTAWLGHANQEIAARITRQLPSVWNTGGLASSMTKEATNLLESFFPSSHHLAAFYSTGMEAAEFALRVARSITKKSGAVGFERNLHGKSLATAQLGWDNGNPPLLSDFYRIPFLPTVSESDSLNQLEETLSAHQISAVFIEPVQGSGGGHTASLSFYEKVLDLCRQHKVLSVFDEILTGFYRTGSPFFFSRLNVVPDLVLLGKGLGNGFPVSAVMVNKELTIKSNMLPGSTYANNPLAAAAVTATLQQMRTMDMEGCVSNIERTIVAELSSLEKAQTKLRGKGALWVIELPAELDAFQIATRLYRRGVLVNHIGNFIRVLPAATITAKNLKHACSIIVDELTKADHDNIKT